jgi:hypothetical protein
VVGTQINLDGNDLPVSQATVDRVSEAVESEWEVADAVDLQQRLVPGIETSDEAVKTRRNQQITIDTQSTDGAVVTFHPST